MRKIIIAGGGWAGCAAAIVARKNGAAVTLLERSDMLLGTGLVGGIFRNNGRHTAALEMSALGAGELFALMDECSTHRQINFPGHQHANLYNVYEMEPKVRKYLQDLGVETVFSALVNKITTIDNKINTVEIKSGEVFSGDSFIDCTGTSAQPANCNKHGNGCAMCILRCHSFGARVSLTTLAGVEEFDGAKEDGSIGAMSGSCKLFKESLSPQIRKTLEDDGVCVIPIPEILKKSESSLALKVCQQYALPAFTNNIILLDTGPAKLMTPFYPLNILRQIPGFEKARYEDPLAGGVGNSMRFFRFATCDSTLQAQGAVKNLFCGGERAGAMVGHTEAIVTGTLAGYNALRQALGKNLITLPQSLAVGDFIHHVINLMKIPSERGKKHTFSGSIYFERMKANNLYVVDDEIIQQKVQAAGAINLLDKIN